MHNSKILYCLIVSLFLREAKLETYMRSRVVKKVLCASGRLEYVTYICIRSQNLEMIRASTAISSGRPRTHFFYPDGQNGPITSRNSRFHPNLGFHPSGEPRLSPPPRGALGDSGRNESAGNAEKTSRAAGGPSLSAREANRRPHHIVFRAL
jgi:hypothetical protein